MDPDVVKTSRGLDEKAPSPVTESLGDSAGCCYTLSSEMGGGDYTFETDVKLIADDLGADAITVRSLGVQTRAITSRDLAQM